MEKFVVNFQKSGSIIALLDEACVFPRSTLENFGRKLNQKFEDHKRITKPKLSRDIGKTSVFVRAGQMAELDARRNAACIIQRKVRSYLGRKSFIVLRSSAIQIQALCRGEVTRHRYEAYIVRKAYKELCTVAIAVQAVIHALATRYGQQRRAAIVLQDAKETGAVQSSKSKLEKEEELEKRIRADMEKARTEENRKLKCALQEMQSLLQETKELHTKELEAIKKAAELAHPEFENVFFIDDTLNKENEDLKAKVARLEKKIDETQKKYEEINRLSDERLKQATEAESKLIEFMTVMQRLEEQLSDMLYTEDQMLGQQVLLTSSDTKMSRNFSMVTQLPENSHNMTEKNKTTESAAKKLAVKSQIEGQNADMEEATIEENRKLKSALQEMQLQETKELRTKNSEAAKKVAELAVPVLDKVFFNYDDTLSKENEYLKAKVAALENKMDETEKKNEEVNRFSKERLKHALKTAMQRFEEKLSYMEIENQMLRQQVLVTSSDTKMSKNLSMVPQLPEKGHNMTEENKTTESVGTLCNCAAQDLGYSNGKPIAAFTIYRCLLHWRSFEAEKTSVFDSLIQMVGSSIEKEENNDHMAYWLSNTSTLLYLLERTSSSIPAKKPPPPTSFSEFHASSSASLIIGTLIVPHIEAKYPALLFKQQLTAYVEKIYGIIRDNVKKELSSVLSSCIQAPKTSSVLKSSDGSLDNSPPANQWQSITECLNRHLSILKEKFVPPVLAQKIFTQVFTSINVQLFNSLLRRECCTFSNGEYIKAGLAEVELWCGQATEEYAGSSWDELKHIRQAVGFLVIHQKSRISFDDITNYLCPVMSVQQLYRICTIYWDDNYDTRSVSTDVISSMKELITEDSSDAVSDSFLLEDNSSIPFSVDDISSSQQEKDFSDVKIAEELLSNANFQFLRD